MNKKEKWQVGIGLFLVLIVVISALVFSREKKVESLSLTAGETVSCFSPRGGCEELIISTIGSAENEIVVAIYTFTSRQLAYALADAAKKGVNVKAILDGDMASDRYSILSILKKNGVAITIETNPAAIMHNKYAVIDTQTVVTGSYNWTRSANISNYENIAIMKSPSLAKEYRVNFETLWKRFRSGRQ